MKPLTFRSLKRADYVFRRNNMESVFTAFMDILLSLIEIDSRYTINTIIDNQLDGQPFESEAAIKSFFGVFTEFYNEVIAFIDGFLFVEDNSPHPLKDTEKIVKTLMEIAERDFEDPVELTASIFIEAAEIFFEEYGFAVDDFNNFKKFREKIYNILSEEGGDIFLSMYYNCTEILEKENKSDVELESLMLSFLLIIAVLDLKRKERMSQSGFKGKPPVRPN